MRGLEGLYCYLADVVQFGTVPYSSIRYTSVPFGIVQYCSVSFETVRYSSLLLLTDKDFILGSYF